MVNKSSFLLVCVVLAACQAVDPESMRKVAGHTLNINKSGGAEFVYQGATDPLSQRRKIHKWIDDLEKARKKNEEIKVTDCRPETNPNDEKAVALTRAIDRIMLDLHNHVIEHKEAHIMLFLHGGNVPLDHAVEESERLLEEIEKSSDASIFPIFLNWDTDLFNSYLNHLLKVRRGKEANILLGLATSPFVFIEDFGRMMGRIPILYYTNIGQYWHEKRVHQKMRSPRYELELPDNWDNIRYPENDSLPPPTMAGFMQELVPGALRVITTPLTDLAGQGTYEEMFRRARVLFQRDTDFKSHKHQPCGALGRLMNELRTFERHILHGQDDESSRTPPAFGIRKRRDDMVTKLRWLQAKHRGESGKSISCELELVDNRSKHCTVDQLRKKLHERKITIKTVDGKELRRESFSPTLRISIIAHSMGGIVANELLEKNSDLYFEDIIYLASAATIRDFSSQALPYLLANPTTRIYNYVLHPYREATEINKYNIMPQGSLLTWLDRFFTKPNTALDRTMGRWSNLDQTLTLLKYLKRGERERLRIEVFGFGANEPQTHGQFNDTKSGRYGYTGSDFWNWHTRW